MSPTPEEKAALEWLETVLHSHHGPHVAHARTLKAMVARPVLPEDLTREQIGVLVRAFAENEGYVLHARLDETFKALRRHLVKPLKRWGVSAGIGWVHFDTLDDAMEAAKAEARGGRAVTVEFRDAS